MASACTNCPCEAQMSRLADSADRCGRVFGIAPCARTHVGNRVNLSASVRMGSEPQRTSVARAGCAALPHCTQHPHQRLSNQPHQPSYKARPCAWWGWLLYWATASSQRTDGPRKRSSTQSRAKNFKYLSKTSIGRGSRLALHFASVRSPNPCNEQPRQVHRGASESLKHD